MIIISSIVVQTRVFLSCNQKLCPFYKSLLNRYELIWGKEKGKSALKDV